MNQKNKPMWNRPWQGPWKILGWFLILAFAVFVIVIGLGLASTSQNNFSQLLWPALGLALGLALPLMLVVWFLHWACCWRNLKRLGFGAVCTVTLIALFYAVENFRAKQAWDTYRQMGEIRGEKFEIVTAAPPPVPDDQNFAMQRIWVEQISATLGSERAKTWFGDRVTALGHTNLAERLQMPSELPQKLLKHTNQPGNWQIAKPIDLMSWQTYYRQLSVITNYFPVPPEPQNPAADVLVALSRYEPIIEELRAASLQPYARFPIGYADANPSMILLPHLAPMKGVAQTLRLRAVAELHANQADKALEDLRLMLRLNEAIRGEPILISHLVNIAILEIELQPIWDGLAAHRWNEAQLTELDVMLTKLDFLADYWVALKGEQAFGASIIDYLQWNRKAIADLGRLLEVNGQPRTVQPLHSIAAQVIPRGWFEQNKIAVCRLHSKFFAEIIDREKRIYSAAAAAKTDAEITKILASRHPYNSIARLLLRSRLYLPSLEAAAKKFVYAQSVTDQARIAIALERHRLATGQFPERLEQLTPRFLAKIPHDIINGEPLKYHRTADGKFILYSVGWNETDDGGTVELTNSGNFDPNKGDWVWHYPPKAEAKSE